jgi:hypothetical protein
MFDEIVTSGRVDEETRARAAAAPRRFSEGRSSGADASSQVFTDERAFAVVESCLPHEW